MNMIIESTRNNPAGAWLPTQGDTCFKRLDGADVAAWLKSQGYEIESNRDTGRNGLAITKCGMAVSSNGRVYDHALHVRRFKLTRLPRD